MRAILTSTGLYALRYISKWDKCLAWQAPRFEAWCWRHVLRGTNRQKVDFLILSVRGCFYNSLIEYQDLLALEERMGDVSTGLKEETIMKFMKQRNYSSLTTESPSKIEPCCICQVISLIEKRLYLSLWLLNISLLIKWREYVEWHNQYIMIYLYICAQHVAAAQSSYSAFVNMLTYVSSFFLQEEYITGETIGTLNCGHDFHSNCIKQWLLKKNVCPICKTVALHT